MTDPTAPHVPGTENASPNQPSDKPESAETAAPGATDGGTATGTGAEPDPRVQELTDLLIHLKADFDNYKKRAQKEQASAVRTGQLEAVKAFLPALANLERALAAAKSSGEGGALVDGVRAIHEQLHGILVQMGIERVSAVGLPFDPSLHEAVAATASPNVPPGTVTDEFEPGYKADGRALIPAKVRVSTAE